MTKTLRASVSFPPALHTSLKVAVAHQRLTLINFVAGVVEESAAISNRAIRTALAGLIFDTSDVRSTVILSRDVAAAAKARAIALEMSQSEFIAAVVAHKLSKNGQGK